VENIMLALRRNLVTALLAATASVCALAGDAAPAVGKSAPEFKLQDQKGDWHTLSQYKGKWVVLYFYPKDDTPGCTKEACSFRDHYEAFREAGAEVIGVSSDSVASHQSFARRHGLPFRLVADAGGELRKRYRVPSTLGLLPGRVTYVIDREGFVRHVFNSQLQATKHVDEALAALRREGSR
jgi:peroxiredoxin Q/BCP